MNRLYRILSIVCLLLMWAAAHPSLAANSPAYEQRRNAYLDTSLHYNGTDQLPMEAYRGLPIDTTSLYSLLHDVRTNGDADFNIITAVRVLFLTQATHQYDSVIMASLNSVKYWINYRDTNHCYWSENHFIMWNGSAWLLHESYGRQVDTNLHNRLVQYLKLKNQFGFYEFNSSVYSPYCLSGLLNLADFAQDPQIKSLATSAAQILMSQYFMRMTNDQGSFFACAGRNYTGKYESPYGQNHNNVIWLLTGLGPIQTGSVAGGFLSTSQIPVDTVSNSWRATLDTTFYNGHSLDTSFILNAGQDSLDKTILAWTGAAYFTPEMAYRSGALLNDSSLWDNILFAPFLQLRGLPLTAFPQISQSLSVLSTSSVIMGANLAEFKHKSVTLSSIQDYFKGKIGFQQFPCVANAGTTAVYILSGPVFKDWTNRSADNDNYHLPYVAQKHNVALMMYRPLPVPSLLPYHNTDVALHFNTADFDEVHTDSLWIIGRQANGYVAARMYCGGEIDSVPGCHMQTDGQAYVVVVGDSDMYGSFSHFQTLIHNSQFSESRYYDSIGHLSVYYAQIIFDTITISYAWGNDSITTGIHDVTASSPLHVYPNPATDQVTLSLDASAEDIASLQITNVIGQTIYSTDTPHSSSVTIDTRSWPQGLYIINGENRNGSFMQKLVKE